MSESAPPPPTPPSSARSSALIAAGILLSRVLGLVRQKLIAHYLGADLVAAAFNGAFRVTNFLQNLFGEGVLSASFIPAYASALERGDDEEADRIAGASTTPAACDAAARCISPSSSTPCRARIGIRLSFRSCGEPSG